MQSKMKQTILCGVGLLAFAGAVQAETKLTANVGVTSNYVFRGVTQTDDNPAVQGGVDYVHKLGFYAGAWASNVELPTGDKGFETDLYVGYNFKLNEDVLFDVGYITYQYSSIAIADADEIYFGASFKDLSLTYYSGDTDGPGDTDYSYIDLKYSIALQKEFNLHLHYGNLDGPRNEDAEDASIGVSKMISGFDMGLTVTTLDRDTGSDDTEGFITVTKTFDFLI